MAPTIDKPLLSLLLSRQVMALSTTTRPAMSAAPLLLQHEEDEDVFLPSPILQEIQVMALSTTTRPAMSAAHLLLQHEEDGDIFLPSPILQEILVMALSTTTRPAMSAAPSSCSTRKTRTSSCPRQFFKKSRARRQQSTSLCFLVLSRQVMALSTTTLPAMSAAHLLLQHEEDEDIFLPSPILQEILVMALSTTTRPAMSAAPLLLQHEEDEDVF
ncbi:hypothetical protein E2562_033229 [Oryza meyeriana var. granulata]|uniref:Uncharacterized protein n=1 Tax=Oryza meyeriana var. granulata TaxID=110450 RepID=A0A6G1BPE0_9ORYZ|nr:hypothetical protein E2562_033229 [Oryza meyeriana var. granulata]